MSGPIIRKYGFPNFDKIFGKKELQHGVDAPPAPEGGSIPRQTPPKPPPDETPRPAEGK